MNKKDSWSKPYSKEAQKSIDDWGKELRILYPNQKDMFDKFDAKKRK
jgi:hypothetical protein